MIRLQNNFEDGQCALGYLAMTAIHVRKMISVTMVDVLDRCILVESLFRFRLVLDLFNVLVMVLAKTFSRRKEQYAELQWMHVISQKGEMVISLIVQYFNQ